MPKIINASILLLFIIQPLCICTLAHAEGVRDGEPPPIKESRLNGDSAIHNGSFIRRKDGKEVLYNRADYWTFAAGGNNAVARQEDGCRIA